MSTLQKITPVEISNILVRFDQRKHKKNTIHCFFAATETIVTSYVYVAQFFIEGGFTFVFFSFIRETLAVFLSIINRLTALV